MHYIKGRGVFELSGTKVCNKRELDLRLARIAGYENDSASFTRLVIESRVNRQLLTEAWRAGYAQRQSA